MPSADVRLLKSPFPVPSAFLGFTALLLWGSVTVFQGGKNVFVWDAAAALCFVGLFFALWTQGRRLVSHPLFPFLTVFLFWQLAAWAMALSGLEGFSAVHKTWAAVALGGLGFLFWEEPQRRLARLFVISVAGVHTFGLGLWIGTGRPDFLLFPANAHYGALWVCAGAFLALSRAWGDDFQRTDSSLPRDRFFSRGLWIGVSTVLIVGVAFSSVRSVQLGFLLGLFVWLGPRLKKRAGQILLGTLGLGGVLLSSATWSRILKIQDPLSWKRWDIWRGALQGILNKPWAGWGPGGFGELDQIHRWPQNTLPVRLEMSTPFAHNDYLQMAAEVGIPGLAIGGAVLIAFFVAGVTWRKDRGEAAAVAAVATTAFFNFPLALPANAFLLASLMALASPRRFWTWPKSWTPWGKGARWGASVVLGLLTLGSFWGMWGDVRYRRGGMAAPLDGRWKQEQLNAADARLHSNAPLGDDATVPEAETLLTDLLSFYPRYAPAWRLWGHLEADHRDGTRTPQALAAYDKALSLWPTQVLWALERVNLLERLGDGAGARAALHAILAREPRFGEASIALGRVMRSCGDPAQAELWLTRLADVWAKDSGPSETLSPYAQQVLRRDRAALQRELALSRMAQKKYRSALAALAELPKEDTERSLLEAGCFFFLGENKQAEDLLEEVQRRDPTRRDVEVLLKRVRQKKGRP